MTEKLPEFKIIRSNRKTLCLEVTRNGEAVVRAPKRISRDRIEAFVMLNKEWLILHMKKHLLVQLINARKLIVDALFVKHNKGVYTSTRYSCRRTNDCFAVACNFKA